MNYMPMQEFKDAGYLQEVNRLFFHPRGLALEVIVDDDGTVTGFGEIQDHRGDPEGVWMTMDAEMVERGKALEMDIARRAPIRTAITGWLIQPLKVTK